VRNRLLVCVLTALSTAALSSAAAPPRARAQENVLAERRAAAKAAPNDVAAQTALGRALIEAGHLPEAEAQMRAASRLAKGTIESLYEVVRVQLATDDYRKARAACRELSAKDDKHVLTHVCMARAFLVWRRASRAFEYIDKALAADPTNYEARLALADAKRMQGEFAIAEATYRELLAQTPTADVYLGLAKCEAVQNHTAEAVAALQQAHTLDANDPDVLLELGKRSEGKAAVELLRAALAGRPGWADAELELAIAQRHAGDAAAAEAGLSAVRKRLPDSPTAVAEHAAALVDLGRYDEAEPELKQALKLIPNDYDAAFALGQLYERTNRNEEAFTQYRNAGDLKRESPEALIAAARLGLSLQRPMLAGAMLDKALERTPRSAAVLALYGEVMLARGDKKAAREYLQRALQGEGPFDRAAVQKRLAALK